MKTAFKNYMCFAFLALFTSEAFGQDSFVRIPLNTLTKPAFDLVDVNGQNQSTARISYDFGQGIDLSTINPTENKFWQDGDLVSNVVVDTVAHGQMPTGDQGVTYDRFVESIRETGLFGINVKSGTETYRLKSGFQVHASLLKAALLRKIGIYQESPKHYKSIKVKFANVAEMDTFLKRAFCDGSPDDDSTNCLGIDPIDHGYISDRNDAQFTLVLHGSYLVKINPQVPYLVDGLTPANTTEKISVYAQSRAFRALVVPFVLGDVGESVNRYSSQAVAIRAGWAYINYPFAGYFNNYTSYDDVRWILRKISQLTDQDWQQIVDAAAYPPQIAPIVKAKLLRRYDNLMEAFFQNRSERSNLEKVKMIDLNYTSGDGIAVNGRVMTEKIPGYPQRFSNGERQSPFESGDFLRLMSVRAQSVAIDSALKSFSDNLLQKSKVVGQNVTGVEMGPNGLKAIGSADIVKVGLNGSANRIVTTGTYYGSEAKVQLVDSLTLAANAGFYHVNSMPNSLASVLGGGVSYVRNFTHVRPIASMKDATKLSVFQVLTIPSKLKQLTSPLKDGNLTDFLQALQVGEVFTITDSFGIAGQLGMSATFDALTAFSGIGGLSVGISADLNKVVLRQIQFVRTGDGLQVYVRNQDNRAFGLEFNVNYFINLLKIRSQTSWRDIKTKVYMLNYNSSLISQVDNGEVSPDDKETAQIDAARLFGRKAALALRSLIRESSESELDAGLKFQRFDVAHEIKTHELMFKFLWFRSTKMSEEHLLTIQKTEVPTSVNGIPVVNVPIQIVTYKKGRLKGKDPFGFGTELADGALGLILGKNAPASLGQESQNPSQMPFGKAHWTTVRTDTELTRNRPGGLPSVAVIDNVWSGWSLNANQLNSIIEEVTARTNGVNFANYSLIPTGALASVRKIDFYRVTAHMSILPEGLNKIRELVLSPAFADTPEAYTQFLTQIVEKVSGGRYASQNKAQDSNLFTSLVKMLGNGDPVAGQQLYMRQCRSQSNTLVELNGSKFTEYLRPALLNGTNYACLSGWVSDLVRLSRHFPKNDLRAQNRWMTDVLYVLDQYVPQAALMNYLGPDKFLFYVDVTGFRSGDEDGNDGNYTSNVYGEPAKLSPYANGLISVFSDKSKINMTELEQASGGF